MARREYMQDRTSTSEIAERANERARDGWRLLTVVDTGYGTSVVLIFERDT
jgi:hypothetical protein